MGRHARQGQGRDHLSEEIRIRGDVIRLGQLLKLADVADSGGEARELLASGAVVVNGEVETRRGRQIHPGDIVAVAGRSLRAIGS